jgi:hypothetical protein
MDQTSLTLSDINYIIDQPTLDKLQNENILQLDDLHLILEKIFCSFKFLPVFIELYIALNDVYSKISNPIFLFPPLHGVAESY